MIRNILLLKLWNVERTTNRPDWLKVLVPLVLSLIATWFTLQPFSIIGQRAPFMLYFVIVFICAGYGGSRSSLIAALCSAACAFLFLMTAHNMETAVFVMGIFLFLLMSLLFTGLLRAIEHIHLNLKQSEERFRGIIEKSSEGFLMTDMDGGIKYISPSVKELLGYTEQDVTGRRLYTLVHPEEAHAFEYQFLKLCNDFGQVKDFLHQLKTKENKWVWIESTGVNLLKDNNIKAIVFHYRNVTDRINKARQQEDFVGMASHELKTPITALKGFLQLLERSHRKEEREKDFALITRMEAQLNRLLNLINDMLDITRIRSGELQYHFEWFNFNECIEDVVAASQASKSSHRIELNAAELPDIQGDKERIGQVINNLINNAVKYSPGKDKVEITAFVEDGFIKVKVKDLGIGIPKDKQTKIFERFYRVEALSKNTFEGLGLGLFISMEIIKKHKGQIGLESDEGIGSEFWFTIPIK